MTVNSFARASTCGTRLFAVLDEPSLVDTNADRPELNVSQGVVRFENVDFQYPRSKSKQNTISGISFEIGSGQTLGIVGPPGSGKSTIARLLPRIYEPTAGRILIDGQDISQVSLASLREAIGGVQQDPFLFTAAVDHNVAYADPLASMDQIMLASTDAQIHSFIEELPQNYETLVGEDGVSLSGGQKQRISIARGTLTDAPIFIFDDYGLPPGEVKKAIDDKVKEGKIRIDKFIGEKPEDLVHAAGTKFFDMEGCICNVK